MLDTRPFSSRTRAAAQAARHTTAWSTTQSSIDLLFLDHLKPLYGPDLRLAEELGLVGKGTVLCADNVIWPGAPEYLEYVRSSVQEKRAAPARSAEDRKGNPKLIYKSELKESFEPTGERDGIEVTRCLGEEAA